MGSLKLTTASSGSVILNPANTASDVTITVPATTATMAINGPAFSAYAGSVTSMSNNAYTKILFDTEEYDTNNNFASSRFTPTVAGYYQLSTMIGFGSIQTTESALAIYKNGSPYKFLQDVRMTQLFYFGGSALVSANGTTDYFEIYVYQSSGGSVNTIASSSGTYFQASMVRSA